MKKGQSVYLKPINNALRYSTEIIESKISKIGRKYFELEDRHLGRFFIDSMSQDGGKYVGDYQCYLSIKEIEEEKEREGLVREISVSFEKVRSKLALSQLKAIHDIIQNPLFDGARHNCNLFDEAGQYEH